MAKKISLTEREKRAGIIIGSRQVALLVETRTASSRDILRGIGRYVREHGRWSLVHEHRRWLAPAVDGGVAR